MKRMIITLASVAILLLSIAIVAAETPYDAERTNVEFNSSRVMAQDDNVTAYGGNISHFNLSIEVQTPYWTGYYGSVTHSVTLSDAAGAFDFYDWGTQDSTGYVMLSASSAVDWGSLAPGAGGHAAWEDGNLSLSAVTENVAATFTLNNENQIDIGASTINAGNAISVNTSSNGGAEWETVLGYDGTNAVYIGVIDQDNENYAGVVSDFQVMVPINASAGNRLYYLYVAIN